MLPSGSPPISAVGRIMVLSSCCTGPLLFAFLFATAAALVSGATAISVAPGVTVSYAAEGARVWCATYHQFVLTCLRQHRQAGKLLVWSPLFAASAKEEILELQREKEQLLHQLRPKR
jgi:hypothetical protein